MTDSSFEQRARRIQWLFLDVDGVLTDGRLYFSENGDELKTFSTLDGLGIKLLRRSGVKVGILSGRKTRLVARRAKSLGLDLVIQGREDKWEALSEWRRQSPVPLEAIAFMGDDWPDLTIMTRVGLSLTVANAHPAVVERSHWQSTLGGGNGAVREACDQLLRARGDYERLLSDYIAPPGQDTVGESEPKET
ncbi:KdsC family phosphatase [Marinimicrobium locisalis]|uniref:KdsC family phosphatase n=1 Tax=Marinimicrobium locisalis TaxID=546022 RepID=UPI0032214170